MIKSTMSGTVVKSLVSLGDTISEDQDVIVLESMKMEMMVQSEEEGKVKAILVNSDDFVQEGQDIIELE